MKKVAGCDSVVKLNLTVVAATVPCTDDEVIINAQVKQGETYLWQCETIETATANVGDVLTREVTLKNIAGCDSVVKLNLTVVTATVPCTDDEVIINAQVKQGESYLWQCETIETATANVGDVLTREVTLKNISGCDSVVKLNLTVVAEQEQPEDVNVTIKQGEIFLIGCTQYKDNYDGIIYVDGKPIHLYLSIGSEEEISATIKEGETFLFGCQTFGENLIAQADPYTYTGVEVGGVKMTLNLTVTPAVEPIEVTATIKKGETFLFGCTKYDDEFDGNVDVNGQMYHLFISFDACTTSDEVTVDATVKQGEDFIWQCETISTANAEVGDVLTREVKLKNIAGCDSIVKLKLTVAGAGAADVVDATITEDETFLFGCTSYYGQQIGVGAHTYTTDGVTLNLTVVNACTPDTTKIDAVVEDGETFLWQCKPIATTGLTEYRDTVTLKSLLKPACDSVLVLNLQITPACTPDTTKIEASVEPGETFLWQCKPIATTGITDYRDTVILKSLVKTQCDSVVVLHLKVAANCPTMMNPLPTITAQAGHILDVTAAQAAILQYYDDNNWNNPTNQHNVTGVKWSVDGVTSAESDKVFSGDTLARSWAKKSMTIRATLVSGDGCDVSGTTTITVGDVDNFAGTVTDTVCAGDSYEGKQIDNFETWTATKQINTYDAGKTKVLSFCDSTYTYNIYVFNTVIPQPSAEVKTAQKPQEGKAFDGSALLDDVKTQVAADKLFARNAVLAIEIKVDDAWQALGPDNDTPAEGTKTLELRISGTSDCGDLTPAEFTLDVAKKDEPVIDPVTGAETVAVCPGDSFHYGDGNYYKLGKYDITLKSAVTGGDSIVTLTVNEYNNTLPKLNLDSMPHAICGRAFNISMINDNIESQIKADETFSPNVKLSWQILGADGRWTTYTNGAMPAGVDNISLRMIATSDCGVLDTLKLTMPVETPSPALLSDHDGLDAGWKYKTWVLMINLNDIRDTYGIDPAPENVVWYRMKGNTPDQTVDEKLGTGHYYTEGKALEGDYYAVIELAPTEKDPCGSVWRTVTIECRSTSAAPQLYPTRVAGGEAMHLISLDPTVESSVRIYDAAGRLLKNITSKDEHELLIPAENMQGIYMVKVESETQKAVLRYVVVK